MTQGVKDLIAAIAAGDSVAIDAAWNAEMATRISSNLDDMRVSVAKNMFATEQTDEEEQEEELTLEDYSIEEIEEFMQSEEYEQLDELSKKTLGSYAHKATDDAQDKAHDAYDSGTPTRHELEVQGGKNNKGQYAHKPLQNRLTGVARAAKKLGDKSISKDVEKSVAHHLKQRYHWDNLDNRRAAISDNAARGQSGKAHKKIHKASGVADD